LSLGDHGRINPHTLCKNLPSCFLGKAHTWWLEQNPIIQRGLTHCDDVEQWCRLLLGAFELYPDETFAAFDAVRYTVRDALNYRHPKTYVHSLTSAAEQCGILENQWASWAWQHLEQPIRRLIPKPRKGVTSRGFADVLQRNLQREYWETKPSWDANHSGLLVLFNPCSQFSLSSLFNSFSQFTSLDQLRHHNLWKEMLILLRRRHRHRPL
jgi:hypothetical protein